MVLLVPTATLLLFILLVGVSAKTLSNAVRDPGRIDLTAITLNQKEGQLYLDAEALIELPAEIQSGLDSGVPLDFILTLKFYVPRKFWFDRVLVNYEQRFSLTYYELTRHYRVRAIKTGTSKNYRSLSAALHGMGVFRQLPLITHRSEVFLVDDKIVFNESASSIMAALDFRLDTGRLPLPLQPLILSSWRLASEEYTWVVN